MFQFVRNRVKKIYVTFPGSYWVLIASTFVDRLGGTMMYPFFTLYVTKKFNVGMTEAGLLLGVFAIAEMLGGVLGGALCDKFGRKIILLFGLIASGLSSIAMGLAGELYQFYIFAAVAGFLGHIGGPARMVMVADLLPEEKQPSGYGMMRVAGNLAWVVGPSIGGLLALRSYFYIFLADAVTSIITAVIVIIKLPETRPEQSEAAKSETFIQTLRGYFRVLGDKIYVAFLFVSILMLLVYQQLYASFPVYLRDVHSISARHYGIIMSINALAVVIFQFRITKWISKKEPMKMMALGTLCFLIAYTSFGFIQSFVFFIVMVLLITFGEMLIIPVSQALVAKLSPPDMRGRYMGVFELSWSLPAMAGPYLAGLIMDNYNPNLLWYISGFVSAVALIGFLLLSRNMRERKID
jgi:MFS family permease